MQAFTLDAENFSDMQEKLEPQLEQLNVEQKDILRAELLVEEIFWRMVNLGNVERVKVRADKKFFGGVQVRLTADGSPYNPLVEVSDWDEDDEEYYRTMILKANRRKLSWSHQNNRNVVTISVRTEKNLQLKLMLASIVGGLVCGILMREFLSPEIIFLISETIIDPSEKMFLNALGLLIAPVMFFSIIVGVTGMGTGAGVGKIGLKLMSLSFGSMVASMLVSCIVAWIFFSGDAAPINTLPVVEGSADSYEFSLIKFVVDIIPSDFVSPILHGKILQIIFVAVFFGISLNALGEKVSPLKTLLGNLNDVFAKMITMVIFFVPLIAFFAMVTLVLELNAEMVMTISKLLVGQIVAAVLMYVLYSLAIWRVGKISFKPFAKKVSVLLPPTFATSSSIVVMPEMMNVCTKKLGISPKISSFAIPIGQSVNMAGAPIYLLTVCTMLIKVYGGEVDLQTLAMVALLAFVISFGAPTVPASGVICIVTIVSYFGVPSEIAGLLFCIDALSDRIITCVNIVANMAVATVLARTENLLDEKIYFRE